MPTDLFSPLTALHRPGQSIQQVNRKITPLTSPAGVFSVRSPVDAPRPTHDMDLLFDSAVEADLFWDWFTAHEGARVPFWLPSYQQDLVPVETIDAAVDTFAIARMEYTDRYFPSTSRRAIIFLRPDGTFLKRDIVGAAVVDADTEAITINAALGEDFTQSNANGICFLWYGRLIDDVASMEWDTATTASMHLKMIELLYPPLGGSGTGGPVTGSLADPGD